MTSVRFGKRRIALPGSRLLRMAIGLVLCLFGVFGFLPLLGFWMVPLGLLVLSADSAPVRRFNRRATVWALRRVRRRGASAA